MLNKHFMVPGPPNKNYTDDNEHLMLKRLVKNKSFDNNIFNPELININKPRITKSQQSLFNHKKNDTVDLHKIKQNFSIPKPPKNKSSKKLLDYMSKNRVI